MRVLITGGAGYVGSRVTAHLLDTGHDVTVFDKLVYGGESLLPFEGRRGFALVPGDIRDRGAVERAMHAADAVIHLAAIVGEQACSIDPEQTQSINCGGTETLIKAAEEAQIRRFIFVSTCSNYGVALPNSLATEDSPLNPLSLYAKAKIQAELLILGSTRLPCATVLRFGTICGISARMRFDLLVSEMAKKAAHRESIQIFAPEAWRPFLHIHDASRAIAHVLQSSVEKVAGRVFNVVGENYQKRGLVEIARRHYPDVDISVTEKNPDLRDYRVDGKRFEKDLGFRMERTVEDAFIETAAAVNNGIFQDPDWAGHSAVPLDAKRLQG
jgi:nucleoside-diphosphate-sugar epimerase